ncbi:hypothetical protein TRVA0_017S00716 [Trichomonascus vanleenenianus]|uniref:tRNA lysidine(34) synthetase n=1 Tax=Trichomonascus vanleenenianus TaxID=2268995 RepID=UPI003EC96616
MALAYLTKQFADMYNVDLLAITVDHQARSGSADEARKVQNSLRQLDIPSVVTQIKWQDVSDKAKAFELNARLLRAKQLYKVCNEHSIAHLLLAHNADDQQETFIQRLISGSTTRGLAGIDAANYAPILDPPGSVRLKYIRPLLGFTKREITATCCRHNVPWVEDETNFQPTFTMRNAIRHLLSDRSQLPQALSEKRIAATMHKLQQDKQQLEETAERMIRLMEAQNKVSIDPRTGTAHLKFDNWLNLSTSLKTTIVSKATERIAPFYAHGYYFSYIRKVLQQFSNGGRHTETFFRANLEFKLQHDQDTTNVFIMRNFPTNYRSVYQTFFLTSEWSPWKLFDSRFWIRMRKAPATPTTAADQYVPEQLTVKLNRLGERKKFIELERQRQQELRKQHLSLNDPLPPAQSYYPSSIILRTLPCVSDPYARCSLGYPTLGPLNIPGVEIECKLKSGYPVAEANHDAIIKQISAELTAKEIAKANKKQERVSKF